MPSHLSMYSSSDIGKLRWSMCTHMMLSDTNVFPAKSRRAIVMSYLFLYFFCTSATSSSAAHARHGICTSDRRPHDL